MHLVPTVLALLAGVTALSVLARRLGLPYPAVMVVGGLAVAFVPGLPRVELSPDVFFTLFLPPLLYAAAWNASWREFRANLRAILLLAFGFVAFTTVAVGWLAHLLVPGMGWPVALALGAIVSPPDAVAATAVAGRLGLPRRLVAILEGESLVNDASGLTLYRLAVAAAVTGHFSAAAAVGQGVWAVAGGVGVGLAVGWVAMRVHRALEDPLVETVVTLLTPFAAFIPAEAMHASGVLAVVTMGLYVSRHSHAIFSPATRLRAVGTWDVVVFVLNGLVFTLLGLQLPGIVSAIHGNGESTGTLLVWAVGLSVALVVVRAVWVFPASYLPRLIPAIRRREPVPPWRSVTLVAYVGMRGADSLAAALALPLAVASGAPFPRRGLVIFLTFSAILFTLVVQSLSLPAVVRWLGVREDGDEGKCEEWDARLRAARAALGRIGELEAAAVDGQRRTLERLRTRYEERVARLAGAEADESAGRCATEAEVEVSVYRGVIEAERAAVVSLRDSAQIGDEVRRRIEYDLDLECARLSSIEASGG